MAIIQDYVQTKLPTLLFSLHPTPSQAIRTQQKSLEFRRRFYQQAFQAFVYTTAPASEVGLFIQCAPALTGSPVQLARWGEQWQADDPQQVQRYFKGCLEGVGLPVTAVATFTQPVSLATLRQQFDDFVTPRGYVFLDQPDKRPQRDFLMAQPCHSLLVTDWSDRLAQVEREQR